MSYSVSTITKKVYKIPQEIDDSEGIHDFLKKNANKKVVVVQGLGFVGAVMSIVCANALSEEYAVIGIDLPSSNSFWKIKSINEGVFPLVADDPKIEVFYKKALEKGNFYATFDPFVFSYADIVIVDINLDVEKISKIDYSLEDFDVNLDGFKAAISSIGKHCKEDALVLVETTVPPGTCSKIVKPVLDDELKRRNLSTKNIALAHSYERVMPGPEYIDSIRSCPRVYAGINDNSADRAKLFLETIIDTKICNLTRLEHTNATEMAKVLENSYRATNIAFAVEWSRFAEEAGVDLYSIVNAIRERKTHSNLMYPGIGVGGYCLTKDPLLASWARKSFFGSDVDLEMSINSVSINDRMPRYALKRLNDVFGSLHQKKVTFLGISYRGDVGDSRFSPVKPFVDMVKSQGGIIKLHDPYISFWEEQNCAIENNIDKAIGDDPDLIIISTGHTLYSSKDIISKLMKLKRTYIYDTVGLLEKKQLTDLGKKHTLSVLGRGDI